LACKKIEQPEMAQLNKECDCAKEVSADFEILEMSASPGQPWNKLTSTDTIFKGKNVQFRALEEDAVYTWYIGQEILTSQVTGRYFSENLGGTNIPITLVVKKKPNSICLPNDDGYDSITKIMHVSQFVNETPTDYEFGSIEGSYRVKSAYLPDSFDIKLYVYKLPTGSRGFSIQNYNGLGDSTFTYVLSDWNYRQLYFYGGTTEGFVHNKMDKTFEANFVKNNVPVGEFHYFGRRL